jgi:hypothetical protein
MSDKEDPIPALGCLVPAIIIICVIAGVPWLRQFINEAITTMLNAGVYPS